MSIIAELTVSLVLVFFICIVYGRLKQVIDVRNKLKWCKKKRGLPILGNALEFSGASTEYLQTLQNMIEHSNGEKLILINIVHMPLLITTNYKFIEFVLSSNSTKLLNKSYDYNYLRNWLGAGLLTSSGEKWRAKRKIVTPTFHFKILDKFIEVFDTNANILINKLEQENGKNGFDIYNYITLCALDIICETAMGVSINAQENKDSDYVRSVKEMCRLLIERAFSPIEIFDVLYRFTKNYQLEQKAVKILHNKTDSVIRQRREQLKNEVEKVIHNEDDVGVKEKKALLDMLLSTTVDGNPLSDTEVRDEVNTFMFGGHDTTSSTMTFATYLLANYPEVQKLAYEEQCNIFFEDKDRPATMRDLQEMKYLENVIKETLRYYSTVPFYSRDVSDDIEYENGKIIPKGTTIIIFAYGVSRDKDNFDEPEKFDPSRFDRMDGKNPFAYVPFSAGPRNCIGQKFAMLEMKCILSKLIRKYELLPSIPEHKIKLAAETVLKSANGVFMRIKRRK
ncbi:cytochrome P450 4d2 [Aethina tumida]|uniref:cytochrome P450 4d2 n=1 Tax=Aethina tumida TaxID=116153 RepID=UPI00096AF398|nr:cytochrome P450 4d2 [Aethina tumida]